MIYDQASINSYGSTMGLPLQTLIMRATCEKWPQRGTFGAASPWRWNGLESPDDRADGQDGGGVHALRFALVSFLPY